MDVATLVQSVLLLLLGYALREVSARRESRTAFERRWDNEKRQVYSRFLALADEYQDVERDREGVRKQLADPEGSLLNLLGDEADSVSPEAFQQMLEKIEESDREKRGQLWDRSKELQRHLSEVGAELEIVSPQLIASKLLMTVYFGDSSRYRKTRESYLRAVRADLGLHTTDEAKQRIRNSLRWRRRGPAE